MSYSWKFLEVKPLFGSHASWSIWICFLAHLFVLRIPSSSYGTIDMRAHSWLPSMPGCSRIRHAKPTDYNLHVDSNSSETVPLPNPEQHHYRCIAESLLRFERGQRLVAPSYPAGLQIQLSVPSIHTICNWEGKVETSILVVSDNRLPLPIWHKPDAYLDIAPLPLLPFRLVSIERAKTTLSLLQNSDLLLPLCYKPVATDFALRRSFRKL